MDCVGVAVGTAFCNQDSLPLLSQTFWQFSVGEHFVLLDAVFDIIFKLVKTVAVLLFLTYTFALLL